MNHWRNMDIGIKKGIGSKVLFLPVAGSTNTFLKINSDEFPDGTIVWADSQTAGRGRGDHKWDSPAGKGLYFSVLLKRKKAVAELPMYSLAAGLAVKEAIEMYAAEAGLNPRIVDLKWPNDLLIAGKKVAGILLEGVNSDTGYNVIAGIGVNLSAGEADFSPELREIAGSLQEFYGGEWVSKPLLVKAAQCLERRLGNFDAGITAADFREESRLWDRKCTVISGNDEFSGVCRDIADTGELMVEVDGEIRRIISGTLRVEW